MITLERMTSATNTAAATSFLEERILPGSGWNLARVRKSYVRLEPPEAFWSMYRVRLGRGEKLSPAPPEAAPAADRLEPVETTVPRAAPDSTSEQPEPEAPPAEERWSEERELRLVARGCFDPDAWASFSGRLRERFGERPCEPLTGLGYPLLFPETQHAFWFYPVDPNLLSLDRVSDRSRMQRFFRAHKRDVLEHPARITAANVELARYVPEINAILRYRLETKPAVAARTVFGKLEGGDRAAQTSEIMQQLWRAARKSGGRLEVPRPLGYYPDTGLYLQSSVPGEAIGSDRTRPEFIPSAVAAAEALATIQESGIEIGPVHTLDHDVDRLDRVLDQFALVHPRAHFLLRDLVRHVRHRLRGRREEEWLPTHGDFKYDQLLHHEGKFSVIDFDYFGIAETSYDVAKYCAYLVPSIPKSWEHSVAAEDARRAFLDRYRELRPEATLDRFQVYEAVNLATRAMTVMWTQAAGWNKAIESLLVLAMERLNTRLP